MRLLNYHYYMRLLFSEPVYRHHFTLRCLPRESDKQRIIKQRVKIQPAYKGSPEIDSFGNTCIYGLIEKAHMQFEVDVNGQICMQKDRCEVVKDTSKIGMFRYHTRLTEKGPAIQKIHEKLCTKTFHDPVAQAMDMMESIFQNLCYEMGITGVKTTAEEAAKLGKGVCQDYAHILLTILRMEHIPCRYVVGMMIGEGASHAWVELFDGEKWVALDPTNNCVVDDRYICISYGRDANDCTINQGYFYGSPKQNQEIRVVVEEVENG